MQFKLEHFKYRPTPHPFSSSEENREMGRECFGTLVASVNSER